MFGSNPVCGFNKPMGFVLRSLHVVVVSSELSGLVPLIIFVPFCVFAFYFVSFFSSRVDERRGGSSAVDLCNSFLISFL